MLNTEETVQDDSTESKGKRARSIALGNAYVKGLGGGGYIAKDLGENQQPERLE